MKRLTRKLVLVGVLNGALCVVFNITHKQRASLWLPKWTALSDEVGFIRLDKNWTLFDALLLQNALIKVTVGGNWFDRVWRDTVFNKRTAIVIPSVTKNQSALLIGMIGPFFHSLDWIVFHDEDNTATKMERKVPYEYRWPACVVPHRSAWPKFEETTTSQKGAPVVFSSRCLPHDSGVRSTWTEAFTGTTISCLCFPNDSPGKNAKSSCDESYFLPIYEALRRANATVIFKIYNGPFQRNTYEIMRDEIDIVMSITRVKDVVGHSYLFPYMLFYRYARFYAHSEDGERWISSFTLLGQSQVVLAWSLLSGGAVWLALSVSGCVKSGRNFRCVNWCIIYDSATFTISSLLSTSASTMFDAATSRSRSLGRTTVIALAVWLLGMIPMSVYFRAVLTSRLSVYVPSNPVDTLTELEAHLDAGDILPCVVKFSEMDRLITFRFPPLKLYMKLSDRHFRYKSPAALSFDDFEQCWRHCATKPGFVCLHSSVYDMRRIIGKNTVESREHFGFTFSSVRVRKDFPGMRAYRNLMQRMFETGLYPKLNNSERRGDIEQDSDERSEFYKCCTGKEALNLSETEPYSNLNNSEVSQQANEGLLNANEDVTGKERVKLSELRSFLFCFMALHLFSSIVCALEITKARSGLLSSPV